MIAPRLGAGPGRISGEERGGGEAEDAARARPRRRPRASARPGPRRMRGRPARRPRPRPGLARAERSRSRAPPSANSTRNRASRPAVPGTAASSSGRHARRRPARLGARTTAAPGSQRGQGGGRARRLAAAGRGASRRWRARCHSGRPRRRRVGEAEPVEAVRAQREACTGSRRRGAGARRRASPRARRPAHGPQVHRGRLDRAGEVGDHQDRLAVVLAEIGEHPAVVGVEEAQAPAPERPRRSCGWRSRRRIHGRSERRRPALRLDVDGLVAVHRVGDDRAVELLRRRRWRSRRCGRPTTASACARRCGRRGGCCRPCRSRRRSR